MELQAQQILFIEIQQTKNQEISGSWKKKKLFPTMGKSSNCCNNKGRPGGKDVAAGTEWNHSGYGAVDGADEGVFARGGFREEETNNATGAARHLSIICHPKDNSKQKQGQPTICLIKIKRDRGREKMSGFYHLGIDSCPGKCFSIASIAYGTLRAPIESKEPKVED